jgi:Leucine-rich repeat (LRR) protein
MTIYKNLKKALNDIENATTLKLKVNTPELPNDLFSLTNLESLYIQSDCLETISIDIEKLQLLKTLYISSIALKKIPQSIFNLWTLETLNLAGCRVETFELEAGKSYNIINLLLNKNQLKEIPANLEHIESLQTLSLSDNELDSFDTKILNLIHLKNLSYDRNRLADLPCEQIKQLKSLKQISLDGNLFSETAKEKIQKELHYWFGEI